jgi:HEAT repeat protein
VKRALTLALVLGAGPAFGGDLFSNIDVVANEARASDPARRRDAIDKLEAYSGDEARPILLKAMSDADTDVRAHAALSIGRHGVGDALPLVVKALGDPEPRLRAAAAEAIGQLLAGPGANEPSGDALKAEQALERALGDGEQQVRQAAVTALGRLPATLARRAAVALTGRLDDESAGVREKTAEVLGRLGAERAVIPLLARLGDTTREVRGAALEALAQLGDARAVPAMVRMLRDPAEEVRGEAVAALGRLRAAQAVPALVDVMERGPDALRGRAAFALGQIGATGELPHNGTAVQNGAAAGSEAAIKALGTALGREDLRAAAREALVRVGAGAVPTLLERLAGARGADAALAVELITQIGDTRATPALLDELSRGRVPDELVIDALGAMARAGDKRPLPPLVGLLASPTASLRRHAAQALRGTVDARANSVLATAASDSDREVRVIALGELGRLGARSALSEIIRALGSSDEDTAEAAAHALGSIGDKQASEALVVALDRPERRVRREAADALARVADPSIVPSLLRAVKTSAPDRRESAVVALGGVLRKKSETVARELLFTYVAGSDAATALAAVDALGAMGDPAAAPRLARILDGNGDAGLRRRAAQALGELDSDEAARALLGILRGDADTRLRAEAAWSLGKLHRAAKESAPALEAALHTAAPPLRANAAAALYRLGRAPQALKPLLDDADPAARANAALALAHVAAARSALTRLADGDDDTHVRRAAKHALTGKPVPVANDWIAFTVIDYDGVPVTDARYRLILPDGLARSGTTDERAVVRDDSVPNGACTLLIDEAPGAR